VTELILVIIKSFR